ncbi:hypothetical protein C1752_01596 [Acaryochloris thomasi RCC1774]|uniref:Uncharacterized protein n=2 Tax=Acaryochloris TaxID=155977 RepID=A0A2W1JKJ6_9CYAN|nr:hypothetical protein C1752_01596 [Acaryochloris thomasi RCC1774]
MGKRAGPVLLFLLLFIWPPLMAFLLTWVGMATGCEVTGEAHCSVAGLDIGWAIEGLLNITWDFPLFGFFPVLWLVVVIVSLSVIHHRLRGCARPFLGILSIWFLPVAPSLLGYFYVARLAELGECQIGQQGVNDCWVFGVNMGDVFATATLVPWFAVAVVPASLVISLVYLMLTWLVQPRWSG